ncbi:class B sortase [Velocimicrobium porci]|uniref:Class B sortase n=1 Tax=Velocimicrobium porci TaxID=2606634 RepID=A0A6L5Y1U8_9FIRM|nr:class B sortase [Velocimicrobium porci]MSS64711.1 class B sortase [Velocimicrobium porci]
MKNFSRKLVLLILTVLLVVSFYKIINSILDYKNGATIYKKAEEISGIKDFNISQSDNSDLSTDSHIDYLKTLNFTSLQKINSDIIGWIMIPDTDISYPLLQGTDNNYYLKHMYNKEPGNVGSIFIDYHLSSDLSNYNTIIYGHRMKNGSMFAPLKYYLDASYGKSHPYVYISTPAGVYLYTIYSAYEGSTDGFSYHYSFNVKENKQKFIDYTLQQAEYQMKTSKNLSTTDKFLTLSTCTGNGYQKRLIVQAVLTSFTPI